MTARMRAMVAAGWALAGWSGLVAQEKGLPTIGYDVARGHEAKPHRRTIPVEGMRQGFNQLKLTLTVSAAGDVTHAEASGEDQVPAEVLRMAIADAQGR
jgi:hypothetical protein